MPSVFELLRDHEQYIERKREREREAAQRAETARLAHDRTARHNHLQRLVELLAMRQALAEGRKPRTRSRGRPRRGQEDVVRLAREMSKMLAPPQRRRARRYPPGAVCLTERCNRDIHARGLCAMHYQQWQRGQNPVAAESRSGPMPRRGDPELRGVRQMLYHDARGGQRFAASVMQHEIALGRDDLAAILDEDAEHYFHRQHADVPDGLSEEGLMRELMIKSEIL
jgi:hypothetical protein